MSGVNLLMDTNICLYLLAGNEIVSEIVDGNTVFISFIIQLELLSFHKLTSEEEQKIHSFIDDCIVIDLTEEIKKSVITLRKFYNLKLPDSIIAATSQYFDIPLISADKGLKKVEEINLLFYKE